MNRISQILIIVLVAMGFAYQANAQGKAVFKKTTHDFGNIKEDGGKAEVTFEFTNTGSQDIKLTYVKASCGCTTPEWTKEPVAPGKTGTIKAIYNPMNRPGKFNKTVTVKTDGDPAQTTLRISGEVTPRKKGIQDYYPALIGSMRTSSRSVYFGNVFNDKTAEKAMVFYNESTKPMTVKFSETKIPAHLVVDTKGDLTINPKDSVKVTFTYDAAKRKDWGFVSDNFMLITDDEKEPQKRFYASATIKENFGNLTSSSKIAMVKFDKVKHDFGKVNQGTVNKTSFTITNEGEADLIIRKTKASCGCTATKPQKNILKPGESTSIDVAFNTAGKKGKQTKNITVITNDPAKTEQRLYINAEVLIPDQAEPKSVQK